MNTNDQPEARLESRFENYRDHLRGVAHRMLGSRDEADDAVQLAWLRADRADISEVDNLGGWLTTVVSRVCLDMLRGRRSRNEAALTTAVETMVDVRHDVDPADEVVLVESVGLALMVVLDALAPAERVAFVLHDLFAVPFDEIAAIVGRSPATTKKLASRARHRVRETTAVGEIDLARRYAIVHAFLAASRDGDLEALVELLAPDVVRRADRVAVPAEIPTEVRGARAVAEESRHFAHRARAAVVTLIDGHPGLVVAPLGEIHVVLLVSIADGRIAAIDVIADPARLNELELQHSPDGALPRVASFDDLAATILARPGPVRLVSIDGPGGAGKSTFAARLAAATGGAPLVHTDDFASAEEPLRWWPRMLHEVIEPLVNGQAATFQRYDWDRGQLTDWITVDQAPIVIIEGVSAGRDEWSDHLAFSIWVDTDPDTRLRRGLDRDGEHMRDQWASWMAAEDAHFETDGARPRADIAVDGRPVLPHDPETKFIYHLAPVRR